MFKSPSSFLGTHSQHQFPTPMESFTWLCDSLPEWMEKLDILVKQVQARQDEFETLSISTTSSYDHFAKKRTGSMESLRPDDKNQQSTTATQEGHASVPTDTAVTTPISATPKMNINPSNRRLFQEYREAARRKRKSSSIRSNTSGPLKFRARLSMVVYYDSEIQSGFESMVRCLASARNTLRKGKNATSYKARMASLAEEESPFDGNRSKLSMRNPRIPRFTKSSQPYSIDSLSLEQFDQIDTELEVAQTLCEIGAHQFLRDASSSDELAGVQEKLSSCLKLAKEGYDIMKVEEAERRLLELRNPGIRKMSEEDGKPESAYSDTKTAESVAYTDSAMGIEIDPSFGPNGTIEIDDDDCEGISIDIPHTTEVDHSVAVEVDTPKRSLDLGTTKHEGNNLLKTGNSMIEVDVGSDDDEEEQPFMVDLSLVRRAR